MSILDGIMSRQGSKEIKIYKKAQTFTNGVTGPITYTLEKTIQGLFYRDNLAKLVVSGGIKYDVTAAILINPADAENIDFVACNKITVTGEGDFNPIYPDDIAGLGRAMKIPLKNFTA